MPREYFHDLGHLNYEYGAVKFTEEIDSWLKGNLKTLLLIIIYAIMFELVLIFFNNSGPFNMKVSRKQITVNLIKKIMIYGYFLQYFSSLLFLIHLYLHTSLKHNSRLPDQLSNSY